MPEEKEYYLTLEGLSKYKEEYEELKKLQKEKKLKIRESRDELWRPEDLNPDFETLRTELNFIEEKIKKIEEVLKNAKIIRGSASPPKKVILGRTVVVEVNGEIDEFTIVGTMEANPSQGKISNESPVGKALLGRKIGETVIVQTSFVNHTYRIVKIK